MVWPERLYVTHSVVDKISWLHSRKTQISKIPSRLWSTIMLRLWLWRYNFTNLKIEYIYISQIVLQQLTEKSVMKISCTLNFGKFFNASIKRKKFRFFRLSFNRWKLIKNTPTVLPPVLRKRKGGNEIFQVYQWLFTSHAISNWLGIFWPDIDLLLFWAPHFFEF